VFFLVALLMMISLFSSLPYALACGITCDGFLFSPLCVGSHGIDHNGSFFPPFLDVFAWGIASDEMHICTNALLDGSLIKRDKCDVSPSYILPKIV